jgi:hypothetical protein
MITNKKTTQSNSRCGEEKKSSRSFLGSTSTQSSKAGAVGRLLSSNSMNETKNNVRSTMPDASLVGRHTKRQTAVNSLRFSNNTDDVVPPQEEAVLIDAV